MFWAHQKLFRLPKDADFAKTKERQNYATFRLANGHRHTWFLNMANGLPVMLKCVMTVLLI